MQNLAHRASFHSRENNAPSKPGIKQLEERHSWLATVHTNHLDWSLSAHRRGTLEPVQSLPEISDHMEMRARYPSDISREQFEQIRALLEGARKK
ncbi:hypothetical protein P0951_22255, partial [Xanthomonas hortorum pv. gardneri]